MKSLFFWGGDYCEAEPSSHMNVMHALNSPSRRHCLVPKWARIESIIYANPMGDYSMTRLIAIQKFRTNSDLIYSILTLLICYSSRRLGRLSLKAVATIHRCRHVTLFDDAIQPPINPPPPKRPPKRPPLPKSSR